MRNRSNHLKPAYNSRSNVKLKVGSVNGHYVYDSENVRGEIETFDRDNIRLRLEDGHLVMLPRAALTEQPDGSYRVGFSLTRFQQDGVMVIPVMQEALSVEKREIERPVRVTKTVRSEDVTVDEPLNRTDVDVTRVAVNRYVTEAPKVRTEGDRTIIPLVEEVLVVERRLLLREEIHITQKQAVVHNPQVYTLRREDVMVERDDEKHPFEANVNVEGVSK